MRRVLSLGDLLLIAAASIGPAFSLATTLGPMVAAGGSATPAALLAITAVMLCIAVGYRRLGERYPNAGSTYTWVRIAFGGIAGAYAAWLLIVANVFAVVATAVPAGAYTLALLAPQLAESPRANAVVGSVWVLLTGLLLLAGLRPTSRVANALVIAEFAVLGLLAAAAALHPPVAHAVAHEPAPAAGALLGAMVIGIWLTDGWEVSASTAEEADDPARAPGLGGIAGLLLSATILWLAMAAFLRVGTPAGFAAHEGDSLAYVAAQTGGPAWGPVLAATVLVSLAASLQATLVYLTRSFFAMGRDRLLPARLGALDGRREPATAIVVLTAAGVVFTLASGLSASLRATFDFILSGTSVFLGVLFLMSAAAASAVFARDRSHWLDGVVLPGIATLALAALLAVDIARADPPVQLFLAGAAALGVPFALWRGRLTRPSV